MKRRILLVDDELAILLTLKAVLELHDFDVETAASAREAKSKIRGNTYHMVITDMRMENERAGIDVVRAARDADYDPAVAMLTAFPLPGEEWESAGADQMLVKPMNTNDLLAGIESDVAVQIYGSDLATLQRLGERTVRSLRARCRRGPVPS